MFHVGSPGSIVKPLLRTNVAGGTESVTRAGVGDRQSYERRLLPVVNPLEGRVGMIGILILVVIGAGFVLWDRRSPVSRSPDTRMVWVGAVLAIVGTATSLLLWWLYVPVLVMLAGASLVVLGRHRVVT